MPSNGSTNKMLGKAFQALKGYGPIPIVAATVGLGGLAALTMRASDTGVLSICVSIVALTIVGEAVRLHFAEKGRKHKFDENVRLKTAEQITYFRFLIRQARLTTNPSSFVCS